MPRPKPDEPTQQVALRLPLSIIERADAYAAQLAAEHPGLQITRTDAMRMILAKHLPPRESPSPSTLAAKPPRSRGAEARRLAANLPADHDHAVAETPLDRLSPPSSKPGSSAKQAR